MNRRRFLTALLSSTAAVAIDPERLLWVPGRKRISIPTPQIHRYGTMYTQKGIIAMVPGMAPSQDGIGGYRKMPLIVRPTIVTTDPFLFDEARELERQKNPLRYVDKNHQERLARLVRNSSGIMTQDQFVKKYMSARG